ncbi:hypothetical protein ACFL20_03070 [Spirochaetota bacterium]
MKINTTINIHKNTLKKITETANFTDNCKTEIIIFLLKKIMDDDKIQTQKNQSVKYQNCDEINCWHKFHISFNVNEYEYFLDLRKICKMSVSYLLAYAVDKYLDLILNGGITDNYLYKNYILSKNSSNGVIFWQYFWGIPSNLEELLKYSPL